MQRFVTGHLEAQVPHLQIPVCVLNPTSSVSGMENKEKEGKTYQTELGFALSLFFHFPVSSSAFVPDMRKHSPIPSVFVEEVRHGPGVSLTR